MSTERSSNGLLRAVILVLAAILLFPMLMMVVAFPMMGMMGWWWGGGTAGGLSPLWGFGMMLLWLGILVGIGYVIYRAVAGSGSPRLTPDPALEELRLAYARGELSDEEFEERRSKLGRDESS